MEGRSFANPQSTNWSCTVPNPVDAPKEVWEGWWHHFPGLKYAIAGKETGADGYKHFQCTLCFESNKSLKQVVAMLEKATGIKCHCEKSINKVKSVEYCMKDGDFIEYNPDNRPRANRGERTDLAAFVKAARESTDELDMFEKHPRAMLAYLKGYQRIRDLVDERAAEAYTPMTVIWVHGPSGTGKSRGARERYPNIYPVIQPTHPGAALWFEGYTNQREILIDDIDGLLISYSQLKLICDVYRVRFQKKGGSVVKAWNTVVITSTKTLDQVYPELTNLQEMRRRITRIVELPEDQPDWCPAMFDEPAPTEPTLYDRVIAQDGFW